MEILSFDRTKAASSPKKKTIGTGTEIFIEIVQIERLEDEGILGLLVPFS